MTEGHIQTSPADCCATREQTYDHSASSTEADSANGADAPSALQNMDESGPAGHPYFKQVIHIGE